MTGAKADQFRTRVVISLYAIGLAFGALALSASSLGLDKTPGFGMVQMVLFLLGLTTLTAAIFLHIKQFRRNQAPRSLQADIGVRLAATGLVFAYVAGLSDLIGIGTHINPNFERPYVGPLQLGGIGLGILSILIGAILYYTSRGTRRRKSSMKFLVNDDQGA